MLSIHDRTLFLDLEVADDGCIHALGAIFGEGKSLRSRNAKRVREALPTLRQWADAADFVCGRNALIHDFPILEQTLFGAIPKEKALDTLLLSPLAFPKKPYHALVKDGKLVSVAKNDPLADSRCCSKALADCIDDILEHFHGALAESRRVGTGDGVVLSTAHKAKGLEFDHVIILDNGWEPKHLSNRNIEEERRVYYVAMTRARKTLALFQRKDCANRFVEEVQEENVFIRQVDIQGDNADLLGMECRAIALKELWIDFAANFGASNPRRRALRKIMDTDILSFDVFANEQGEKRIELKNRDGISVASLSKRGISN